MSETEPLRQFDIKNLDILTELLKTKKQPFPVICIGGLSASGKTTFANELVRQMPQLASVTLFDLDMTLFCRFIRDKQWMKTIGRDGYDWFRHQKAEGMISKWLRAKSEGEEKVVYPNIYSYDKSGQETYLPQAEVKIDNGLLVVGWAAVRPGIMAVMREQGIQPVNIIIETSFDEGLERIQARAVSINDNAVTQKENFIKIHSPSWQKFYQTIADLLDLTAWSSNNSFDIRVKS